MQKFSVKKEESNQTLEKYIKKLFPNIPLSFLEKLFRKKDIKVNGHWEDKNISSKIMMKYQSIFLMIKQIVFF